jgi:peroxiredoxin
MLKVGDRLPEGSFKVKQDDGTAKDVSTHELFDGQKVVLVAVPGAFTSTCHNAHIPTFVRNAAAIRGKGVDRIVVMAVNDHHVMKAWKEAQKAGPEIDFVADGSGTWTRAAGIENDLVSAGMGMRAKRLAAVVEDGVVKHIAYEPPGGKITVTGAEAVLEAL